MAKKWNLMVDVGRCHNSNNCFLSVVDEYAGNDHGKYAAPMPMHGHRWLDIRAKERGQEPMVEVNYVPVTCNHCDDAPCIKAAENGAIAKRPDGIVVIDPVKAKGQKHLVDACPYGAIWWNEELELPQAWPFDAHLLDRGWTEPRMVTACPTGAIRSALLEDSEMEALAEKESLEVLHPEYGTRPRVWYKNLHLYSQAFIAGTVVAETGGVEDCVAGATVTLTKDGTEIGATLTDAFGEFKCDRLEPGSGSYQVTVDHPELGRASAEASLGESTYIGVLKLTA